MSIINFKKTLAFFLKYDRILIESKVICSINRSEVLIMAYKMSDECISCGACAGECPVGAISEGDGKYVIDADTCIDCGACAGTCPVSAPAAE